MALLKRKRSGLNDPMSVVTNFVNACNRHDAEGVSACLHPDFDSIQPMYPSRNFRGADQVRRNWQAIFDAEPGFRLTVLRTAAAGDTVWLELHGAGRDAEVAGVFVMGIQGDRIRWARIYSALVEDGPAMTSEDASASPAPLREVPPLDQEPDWTEGAAPAPAAGGAHPVEEDLIAPVVDIDDKGRTRRGRRRKGKSEPDVAGAPVVGGTSGGEPVPGEAAPGEIAAFDPVLEDAAKALHLEPERATDELRSGPADSIDPEPLVDPAHHDGPERGGEPAAGVIPDPDLPAEPGSDYDLKEARDLEEARDLQKPGDLEETAAGGPMPDLAVAADSQGVRRPETMAVAPAPPETALRESEPPDTALRESELAESDLAEAEPDPNLTVETMVEVDPGTVVKPEVPMEPEPEIFVELSIPEGAVDPDPEVHVTLVVPEGAPDAQAAGEAPTHGEAGLIVTTPPAPAADSIAANPPATPPKAPKAPKARKRKPPKRS